jgi:hypothetical protein
MTHPIEFPTIGISAAEANMLYHLRRMEAIFNRAGAPWTVLEELEFHVRAALSPHQADAERAVQEAAKKTVR